MSAIGAKNFIIDLSTFPIIIPKIIGTITATRDIIGILAIPEAPNASKVKNGPSFNASSATVAASASSPYVFTSDKYKEPLLFVTPATIDNAVRPQNPACPNTFPTTIPRIAPIKNLDNSNVPPLFRTAGISFNCNVVPRQNNCSPIHVAAPALENAAVVNPPISNACGNNVCMTAPISNGTSISPAGTFCKNFIIIFKPS